MLSNHLLNIYDYNHRYYGSQNWPETPIFTVGSDEYKDLVKILITSDHGVST